MMKNQNMKNLPKRIQKEIQRLGKDAPPGISIAPTPDNYRYFQIVVAGPSDTPYEGGIFKLEMFLTKEYPMKPPKCRFLTKIYHPNVDKLGRICLDVLKDKWTPALTISRVCLSIQLLMQVRKIFKKIRKNANCLLAFFVCFVLCARIQILMIL